jgi:tetratricopeptide (TPR) repeat protein
VRVARWFIAFLIVVATGVPPSVRAQASPTPPNPLAGAERALSAGDAATALALATAHAKKHPDDPRARVLVARVHIARGDFDAAYVELRRALAADPKHVDALYYLGFVTAGLAQSQFERLVTMAPESGRARQLMAESLEAQGRNASAEEEYDEALKASPELFDALVGLAKLKRIRLACEEAIPLYQRAEKLRPTFEGAYGLGICQAYLQEDEDAAAQFERAVERDPRAAVAWVGLGTALNRLGRTKDAIAKLQRAIELEPGMGEAYYALALAYQADGQADRAKEAFEKAEQLGGAVGR